jgi:hypothetical protein
MAFQIDPGRIVFEAAEFIIYDTSGLLPKHKNFPYGAHDVKKPWNGKPAVTGKYYEITDRELIWFYFHQTAGSVTEKGFKAVLTTTSFVVRNPKWVQKTIKGKLQWVWTGTGRGWPGCCYPFYLPYEPEMYKGKIVIFMNWGLDWIVWHSSHNANASALGLQGYYFTRHIKNWKCKPGQTGHPSDAQWTGLKAFTAKYVLEELKIKKENLRGHCDSPRPKPTCPGDDVESWKNQAAAGEDSVLTTFEEPDLFVPPTLPGMLDLPDWHWRQAALVAAGHDLGSYGPKGTGVDGDPGDLTRAATEAQEGLLGLPVDGYWDDTFDFVFRMYLLGLGITEDDLKALI